VELATKEWLALHAAPAALDQRVLAFAAALAAPETDPGAMLVLLAKVAAMLAGGNPTKPPVAV